MCNICSKVFNKILGGKNENKERRQIQSKEYT
jgi:hypothetical protein